MKLRREARTLKGKALSSLRRAVAVFNDLEEDGRVTCVLLHLQHAAEMLLKAILVQKNVKVFDASKQTSIGFEKCLHLGSHHAKLTKEEAGLLRAIDAFRDAEQHWPCRNHHAKSADLKSVRFQCTALPCRVATF